MDEIDFDLSCFDLSDTPDASRESPPERYEVGADIDWLAVASKALRAPVLDPLPRERAARGSSAGIQLLTGFDDDSVTIERVRAASEPPNVD